MKAFPNPPEAVLKVGAAVMCLLPPGGKIPRPAQRDWKACKASMGNVDQFLRKYSYNTMSLAIILKTSFFFLSKQRH